MTEQTTEDAPATPDSEETEQSVLTLWQMLGSVIAAAFGVQSSKNRERDFSQGKPIHFIILGVGFTAVFVLVMIAVVRLILSSVA
jgi:hypothetical protein